MLAKKHRLTTQQFDHVWTHGTSACGAFVCARVQKNTNDLRCACIAPKKHAPTAVQRARLRRRLYGACASLFTSRPPHHEHIIISPKNSLVDISFEVLSSDIAQTITKARGRAK